MENDTYTVDITPSWRFLVKGLLQVLKSHSKKSLPNDDFLIIKKELLKCSDVADKYNEDASLMAKGVNKMIEDQKYYGYTNKVTHTVMSMIDNDEGLRDHFISSAMVSLLNRIDLGQHIKDYFLDQKPTISKDSFTLDHYNESMLSWAYGMVNWEEIADHILDAVAEENK